MDQSLKGATPIRNKFTKISSACSHSEKNHQGDHIKQTKQTPKKPTAGKQPSASSIKKATAARKLAATTGGVKKPH